MFGSQKILWKEKKIKKICFLIFDSTVKNVKGNKI